VQFLKRRSIFKNTVSGLFGYCSHMGLGQTNLQELTKVCYDARFGFYAPKPNWPHVPEWLEEASCNS
jgi:hypothetical protein